MLSAREPLSFAWSQYAVTQSPRLINGSRFCWSHGMQRFILRRNAMLCRYVKLSFFFVSEGSFGAAIQQVVPTELSQQPQGPRLAFCTLVLRSQIRCQDAVFGPWGGSLLGCHTCLQAARWFTAWPRGLRKWVSLKPWAWHSPRLNFEKMVNKSSLF